MAKQGIELEIYPFDNPTVAKQILPGRLRPQALSELKGVGGGSFSIDRNEAKVAADPTLLKSRNVCKVRVDGTIVDAFLLGGRDSTIVSEVETDKTTYDIVGEGLKAWFDDADVYPRDGLQEQSSGTRSFNFSTERGSWYNASDWINPFSLGFVHSSPAWDPRPDKWPTGAPYAQWIWGSPYSISMPYEPCYFRWEVTITTAGLYAIYAAVDDRFSLYIDGSLIASSDPKTSSSYETSRVEVTLTAGAHVIGFIAQNQNGAGFQGPAALAAAMFMVNADKTEVVFGKTGDANWKVLPYPAQAPGWTAGEVLLKLLDEAEDRGVLFPTWLNPTFSATLDSNGNPWGESMDWTFKVGESYASVISKLEESLVDIWIDPVNYNLNMVPVRGVDRTVFVGNPVTSTPVEFKLGKHLLQAKTKSKGKIKNALMAKTNDGYFEAEDEDSVNIYGRLEGSIDTGTGKDLSLRMTELIFGQRAQEEEGATYDFIVIDKVPLVDFNIGDWVLAPNERREQVKRRVMSISIQEDDSGKPKYAIEFDTIFQDNEQRLGLAVAKLGGGGVGGSLVNVGGDSTSGNPIVIPPGGPVQGNGAEPKAPTGLEATSIGVWSPDGVDPFSQVTLIWDPVTQDINNNALIPEFYEVWGKGASTDGFMNFGYFTDETAVLYPFMSDEEWTFKVRAISVQGVISAWSIDEVLTTVGPDVPLIAPEPPIPTSSRGTMSLTWNGLLDGELVPPPQFRYIYAEVSSTGATGPWARMGAVLFREGRTIALANLTVGNEYWARFIAVDGVGLKSEPSTAVSHVVQGIVGPDIQANSVDANVIIAGSIKTNHISPEVGAELNLVGNGSVNIIVGEAVDVATGEIRDNLDEMQTYYQFGPSGAEISSPGSVFSLALRNDRIEMLENGNVVSYWNSGTMYVTQFVGEDVILGNHQIAKYEDGTVVRAL